MAWRCPQPAADSFPIIRPAIAARLVRVADPAALHAPHGLRYPPGTSTAAGRAHGCFTRFSLSRSSVFRGVAMKFHALAVAALACGCHQQVATYTASSGSLALSNDDSVLYAVDPDSNQLFVVDSKTEEVKAA